MQRLQRFGRFGLVGTLACLTAGCGGDEVAVAPPSAVQEEVVEDDEEWVENAVPVIATARLEPAQPVAGASVVAQVRVEDPDGDEVEVGYAWRLNGRPARTQGETLPLANALKGDTVEVTITASDGWDESEPITLTARIGNTPPLLQSIAFDPLGTIHRGQSVTARPIAMDPDGDPLEYEYKWWVNGEELSSTSDVLDTSRLKRGDQVRVSVIATDGYTRSNEIRSEVIQVENSPPKITSTPANAGGEGSYLYQVEARDPDGDRRLRFRLEAGPPGMVIDPIGGAVTWTPAADASGTHTVEVAVDDLQGGVATQRFTVVIGDPEPEPGAPTASTTAEGAPSDEEETAPAAAAEDR